MASQPTLKHGGAILLVAVVLIGALGLYGVFHHERSIEAYCQTWQDEGQKLHDQWEDAQRQAGSDPFASVPLLLGAAGDLAGFFNKLSKVAPKDIEPDVVRYKEALEQVSENLSGGAGNLLGLAVSQMILSAQTAGVERRIDTWTSSHCDGSEMRRSS